MGSVSFQVMLYHELTGVWHGWENNHRKEPSSSEFTLHGKDSFFIEDISPERRWCAIYFFKANLRGRLVSFFLQKFDLLKPSYISMRTLSCVKRVKGINKCFYMNKVFKHLLKEYQVTPLITYHCLIVWSIMSHNTVFGRNSTT